ncbi:transmembrane protein 200A [Protopterus annectens]|uniref:transmembrane protein 200A n=1 Tax=Protopterus annectens TaxID=7888 RepID=UPI001CFACAF5|nr:transmembrane protein 200A [Protopterus annectens]XP_043920397.1 transmembrane protein 200A [Protopterus annectens]
MIATGGVITGLAALKRQDSARSQHHLPHSTQPLAQEKKRAKRRPRTDVVVVRGKIRLYSPSGFFLILGVLVSMMGIAMAVLGYWPVKGNMPVAEARLSTNDTQITRDERGLLAQFFEQHLHSDRMKMLGPFTMGIGIFIFICANAILHENRDRETKIIHMRDIYSTVIDIHSLQMKEQKYLNGAYTGHSRDMEFRQHENQCASKLAANTLLSFTGFGADSRRVQRGSASEDEDGLSFENRNIDNLLPPLCRVRSGSIFGLHPETIKARDDKNSSTKRCETKSIVSSSISAFTLPVIKLNNCVIDEPDIDNITVDSDCNKIRSRNPSMDSLAVPLTDTTESFKATNVKLMRSNSAIESSSSIIKSPSAVGGKLLSPGAAKKDFGSNTSLHMLSSHSKSLDLDRGPSTLTVEAEQRKHPSWPRLDRSNSKGYMKLENKEDPMDRLPVPQNANKKDYSNKEKLLMISRSHNNLSFEHNEFLSNSLKRGTSETRF